MHREAARRAQLLEFAVLGLLHEGPTHGYDLRRRLNTALGPFRALSYGTLYPRLRDMVQREALVLAYNDVLLVMAALFLLATPLVLLLAKPRPEGEGDAER